MKKKKIIEILVNAICHDPLSYDPIWKRVALPNAVNDNYNKILSTLKLWENNGYIKLLNDDEYAFVIYPENLPSKERLIEESNITNEKKQR